ncbi:2-iminoacetate synthase ThiH [bacterium]|nr:2-iminoacetate synthase ThiH [bacterium]
MTFFETIKKFDPEDIEKSIGKMSFVEVKRALAKNKLNELDLMALLSTAAQDHLEEMAQKARSLTVQYFGRTVSLYAPLYISNHCINECIYCGFNRSHTITRKLLTHEEIEREARFLNAQGIRHILLLTGEAHKITPLEMLSDVIKLLRKYFPSVSIEVYPMDTEDYRILKKAGVDGITVYQEVYDTSIYDKVHPAGRKKNYKYRLETPERAAKAGLRYINIGTLFGLAPVRSEAFLCALHAKYLENRYLDTEISLSIPRIRNIPGGYSPDFLLSDRLFVQILLAYRLFLPRSGITVSTRETSDFRDNLLNLGVTRFSAGSHTEVGGYTEDEQSVPQFEISDSRSVEEIVRVIREKGLQPIFKDWEDISQ